MAFDEGLTVRDGVSMDFHCLAGAAKPGDIFPGSHYHEYIELLWGQEGITEVSVNGSVFSFGPGELFVVNSNEPHTFRAVGEPSRYLVTKLLPRIINASGRSAREPGYALPFMIPGESHPRVVKRSDPLAPRLGRLMEDMLDRWVRHDYGYELAIRGDILLLFSELLGSWRGRGLIRPVTVPDQIADAVTRSLEYTANHYDEADEARAAKAAGFSPAYFSRCFRRVMGMTYSSYLTLIRMSRAEELLAAGDLSVTQIAESVGYSTSSHFSQIFKKRRGCSPREFRIKVTGQDK